MTNAGVTIVEEILVPYEHVRKGRQNEKLRDLWASYWGTTYATSQFWFAYAQYYAKLEELDQQLQVYAKDERSKQLFGGAVSRLRAHYDVGYLANTTSNIASLDETFNIIHLASALLPKTLNEPIEVSTAESISTQIRQLIDELEGSDLSDDLKRFLKSQFVLLLWAASNYNTVGIDGLSKVYGMVASEFMRVWGKKESGTRPDDPWWKSARAKLKLIGEGVIWSEKLASGAEKLLSHGDDLANLIT